MLDVALKFVSVLSSYFTLSIIFDSGKEHQGQLQKNGKRRIPEMALENISP
jgi:hypothetical protein